MALPSPAAVISTTPPTTASELTTEQVQRILIMPLQQQSTFLSSGVRFFDVTAAGPVRIPTLVASDAPSWTLETQLISEVGVSFSHVSLLDGIASLKSITRVSAEALRAGILDLSSILSARLVLDIATKLDSAMIAGDGTPNVLGKRTTPLGIVNYAGVQHLPIDGALSLDALISAVGMAMVANVPLTNLRWMMRPEVLTSLRKIKDTQGHYLLQPDPTLSGGLSLIGLPVTVTTHLPVATGTPSTSSVVVFDPSTIAVARDLTPSVRILSELFAQSDEIGIRVIARYDSAPLLPQAIVLLDGVTTGS
jgi:HK97 family phage major capsid protein